MIPGSCRSEPYHFDYKLGKLNLKRFEICGIKVSNCITFGENGLYSRKNRRVQKGPEHSIFSASVQSV